MQWWCRLALPAVVFLFSSLPVSAREYTQEHPLVYEDAWDLWPYVFLDDQGHPCGYNIDLITMLMNELAIPFEIHLKPTQQALEDLRKGTSDLMLGMVANFHDEYTTYYGKNVIQLFTHSMAHLRDATMAVHSTDDLSTQQVIVHEGSFSHHLMIARGWEKNAIPFGDMDKAIQMVSAEGSGQVLWNTMSLKWLIHKYHADNLVLSPVDMPSGDYRFMSHDKQLLDLLDATFERLKADDYLAPLEQRWFYPERTHESSLPRWLWYAAGGFALAILLLFVIILIYRIRERNATKEGRLRNARLSLILKTCQVKVWTYDIHHKTFTWYGDKPHDLQVYSQHEFAARHRPEEFAKLMEAINQLFIKSKTEERLRMTVADGENGDERSYIVSLAVLHNEKGHPSVIIGTKRDVTEEYRKQLQSVKLIHRYKAVFNTALVDMVSYDSNGLIMNMNARAQETFKMKLEDVLREQVKLSDILSPEVFDIKDFASTDQFTATLRLDYAKEKHVSSRKRQGEIYYEFQLVPVFDDGHRLLGAYGTGLEVTEVVETFHKAQDNVKQLRTALQEVAEHVNNINYALQVGGVRMVTYSPSTHLLTINHRMHEAQYVLTQQRCLDLTHLDSVSQVMRIMRAMDRRANRPMDCELKTNLRVPGGKRLWLQMHLFPTLSPEGVVTGYAGICRDTTEIMFTEKMLQQETAKAQEVEQVKSKFLHNMCYEIRTPLDIVVGYAEMFEKEHSPEDEDLYIDQIKTNTAYLLNLINDILFLSRLDAGMVETNVQPCDFAQTFEAHCHMGMGNNKRDGVKYLVENPYSHLVVNIDGANVGRIIQQVVNNAVTHTVSGSVKCRYDYIGSKLMIVVEDTSNGIPAAKLPHIFERFNSPTTQNQDTGLELPICKELATLLGGTIDINSEEGVGTSIWITIPCEASTAEHQQQTP